MDDITVKAIEDIEAYSGDHEIPGIRFRPARKALGVTAWGMNILELDPHCEGYPEHDHAGDGQEEVYVVLRGAATLKVGDQEHRVVAGQLVRVSPSVTRKFVTTDQPVTLLALGGTPGAVYEANLG